MSKPSVHSILDGYLEEQQNITAVDLFSEAHSELPSQAKFYSKLLPTEKPQEGEQYAFEVDLDKCSGCKACVTACHSLNGLDPEETWRDVGVLQGGDSTNPFLQTVTTACHHCGEPACMDGCPVNAYDKDPVTGIVKHLDDQCIGCQYCILKCPFDVPKYNSRLGIVRKCDMCTDRLAVGEAPACVQACPTEAIAIKIINKEENKKASLEGEFLPGAPDPSYTQPTTQYKTTKTIPENTIAADHYSVQAEHPHWPLVIMLVLTQFSIGAFTISAILRTFFAHETLAPLQGVLNLTAMAVGLLALTASVFHLGRPLYAWRAFVGLRTSWMSREIIILGGFAKLAIAYGTLYYIPEIMGLINLTSPAFLQNPMLPIALGWVVVATGLTGIYCSVKIYSDTRKDFWKTSSTITRFYGTAVVLGLAGVHAVALVASQNNHFLSVYLEKWGFTLSWITLTAVVFKLAWNAKIFIYLKDKEQSQLQRSAILMTGALKRATIIRYAASAIGGIILPLLPWVMQWFAQSYPGDMLFLFLGLLSFLFLTLGEFAERFLFFAAAAARKMPGNFR